MVMIKAATSRRLNKATRWLMASAILMLLSSLQSSFAIASVCQAASCHCRRGCGPQSLMHHQSANTVTKTSPLHFAVYDDSDAQMPSGLSCCRALPQSDRTVVVTSSAQEAGLETETASLLPLVEPVALASIRAHDPPDTRPLYLTNSCLLI